MAFSQGIARKLPLDPPDEVQALRIEDMPATDRRRNLHALHHGGQEGAALVEAEIFPSTGGRASKANRQRSGC